MNRSEANRAGQLRTTEDRRAIAAQALADHQGGLSLRQIAEQHGVSHIALRKWLLDEVPDQYRAAQKSALIHRIVDADEELDRADNAISIARAREAAKFARWDAERRLPRLFALNAPAVQINVNLGDVGERIRELERELLGNAAVHSVDNSVKPDADDTQVTDNA